jgi:hypothetical protein
MLVYLALDVERDRTWAAARRARDPVARAGLLEHAANLERLAGMIQGGLVNAARARGDLDVSMFERKGRR